MIAMLKKITMKLFLAGLIFGAIMAGSSSIIKAQPIYHGYWELADISDNYNFIKEGLPANFAFGRPKEIPALIKTYGYRNVIAYLADYFNNDRNNNGKVDIGEEEYWPIIFDDIARDISGYEKNIIAFYLMDEPYAQAENISVWLDTNGSSFDFDKIKFAFAGDYNGDGRDDLAVCYDEAARQKIYVSVSNGRSFDNKTVWLDMFTEPLDFRYVDFVSSGDYNGDGLGDIAVFYDSPGPINNSQQKIFIYTSNGGSFQNRGAWFDAKKSDLDFDRVKFVSSGDYNGDGKDELAIFYQEGIAGSYRQKIYVYVSKGNGFNKKSAWFDMPPEWFHFNYVKFALSGDYDGDGKDDIAMFYNYPSPKNNPPQKVFVYTSNGSKFQDKGAWIDTTKSALDFDRLKFALSGERDDYNGKKLDDISVFCYYPAVVPDPFGDAPQREFVYLSNGSLEKGGFIDHRAWNNSNSRSFTFSCVDFALSGDFNGDGRDDTAMFYDYPSPADNPPQKIFVGCSTGKGAWTNRALLERLVAACKNKFPGIPATMDFMQPTVMLGNTIPANIDWITTDPYPFFNGIAEYPHPDSWKRYDTWVNAAVRKIQNDMPGKPILLIGQSFRNIWWRIPVPEEEKWFFDTVKNFNLLGLMWFKYNDAIYGAGDGRNVYGVKNYPGLIDIHKKIGNEIINNIFAH